MAMDRSWNLDSMERKVSSVLCTFLPCSPNNVTFDALLGYFFFHLHHFLFYSFVCFGWSFREVVKPSAFLHLSAAFMVLLLGRSCFLATVRKDEKKKKLSCAWCRWAKTLHCCNNQWCTWLVCSSSNKCLILQDFSHLISCKLIRIFFDWHCWLVFLLLIKNREFLLICAVLFCCGKI